MTRRKSGALILVALVLVVVGAVVALTLGKVVGTNTLTGELDLAQQQGTGVSNYTIPSEGVDCHGLGGYSDVRAGAQIVVKDENGKIIGSGSLGPGSLSIDLVGFLGAVCAFNFEVSGLPTATQYEVGLGSRGSITYSHEELTQSEWEITLTLGP